ncbi:MAG: archease [Candidatus Omnitrophica bacterium]|nr:archease [Candidatus Omnitrophota bacterium]
MKKYEFIEHTADLGIRVYGKTFEELFTNAAFALTGSLVKNRQKTGKTKKFVLEGQTSEDLMFNWLNELISLFFADKFLSKTFNLKIDNKSIPRKLEAEVRGIDFDPYSNKINMEIKAATYHNLKIEETKDGFKAEIIFDV